MIVPVEKQFTKIEEQRKKLLEEISRLSHEQQNFKPSPESWSIAQVLNHLIFAETNTVKYIQKKILGASSVQKSGVNASFRSFMLKAFLKLPVKYKAPKAALPAMEDVYIFENLQKQWDDVRIEFRKILDQLDAASSQKLLFKHPIVGRFDIYHTMTFLTDHIGHHEKQIERIKASTGFPNS